ncbi:MAG: nuclear transport factor 2 family protein, partial [Flavobacteriales bacterium]|nr:nuclear transport factor 2 family protein [Flavobacteriales bacterium]MDW8411000.1 nuclear transport factor 2 family protein [Flavobacteriales bacterium]
RAFPDTAAMGKLTFDVLNLHVYDHTAVMTGRWTVMKAAAAPRSGLFTLVWRRLGKNWKIVYDHTP